MCPSHLTPQEHVSKPRLVVVDDEPSSIKAVQKHLRDAGYDDVIATSDPTKAVDLIVSERPDLVLLDIIMPKLSGLDILQEIRSRDHFRHLPIIILTASTELHVKARALALGVTDFLQKPIDPTELLPRIRNALSIKALRHHCQNLAGGRPEECPEAAPPRPPPPGARPAASRRRAGNQFHRRLRRNSRRGCPGRPSAKPGSKS
jgi:DNA-binding response OmpR family regulator